MTQAKFIIELDTIRNPQAAVKFIAEYIKMITGSVYIEVPKDFFKDSKDDLK